MKNIYVRSAEKSLTEEVTLSFAEAAEQQWKELIPSNVQIADVSL